MMLPAAADVMRIAAAICGPSWAEIELRSIR